MKPGSSIFLLGGHDLEMIEIKKMLESHTETYVDKNLMWGAKLSQYQDVFDEVNAFVGIELIEDCPPPKNYIPIDHHNEKSHLPSAIEQIAELLGITLSRFQMLIAENDKGYIPALIKAGATDDEVKLIRKLDRKAQGVTENDEKLASESLQNNCEKIGNLTIINAQTRKFSPITDQLFPYKNLLIYYETQLVYYGTGVEMLVKHYAGLIDQNTAFHGGGATGFFGIADGSLPEKKFQTIKDNIINLTKHL